MSVETIGLINLALNKATSSSPPHSDNFKSWKAVDGLIGGDDSSCFYAGSAKNGYLSVNLGKKVRVQRVVVHGRIDGYGQLPFEAYL